MDAAAATPLGLLLAVAAAMAWAGLDAARKKLAGRVDAMALAGVLALGHVPFFSTWAALGEAHVEAGYALPGLLTAVFGGGGMLLFIMAMERAALGVTVPVLSLTPVLSSLGAWLLVDERPTPQQIAGGVLVVGGAVVLFFGRGPATATARAPGVGLGLMALSAVAWSMTAATDKWALQYASTPVHGAITGAAVTVIVLVSLHAAGRVPSAVKTMRGSGRWILLAMALSATALSLQLLALQEAWVAAVEAIKRVLGVAAALAIGRLAFDERPGWLAMVGAAIMTAGGVLVVVGT